MYGSPVLYKRHTFGKNRRICRLEMCLMEVLNGTETRTEAAAQTNSVCQYHRTSQKNSREQMTKRAGYASTGITMKTSRN